LNVGRAALELRDPDGRAVGELVLSVLPSTGGGASLPRLLDLRGDPAAPATEAPVQLLESAEYRYAIELRAGAVAAGPRAPLHTNLPELFSPDSEDGRSGRLRTGVFPGTVQVEVFSGDQLLGRTLFEIRSRKLRYADEFRWMVQDLAEETADLVFSSYAPSGQSFTPSPGADDGSVAAKVAFLGALLEDDSLQAALRIIFTNPYESWEEEWEIVSPAGGLRNSGLLQRELARLRPASLGLLHVGPGLVVPLPATLELPSTVPERDNEANRFIRFTLDRWLTHVESLRGAVSLVLKGAPRQRAERQLDRLQGFLEESLAHPLMAGAGPLTRFPSGNQVLEKRAGYREVYRAFEQSEMGLTVDWEGGADVFVGGHRDIAALYEYWVFLRVARVVSGLLGQPLPLDSLFQVQAHGLRLGLRRRQESILTGSVVRGGRTLTVSLHFNRTFSPRTGSPSGRPAASWSRPMRPDLSLLVVPQDRQDDPFAEIWVHFDAKYRLEGLRAGFGEEDPEAEQEDEESDSAPAPGGATSARRDDLLRMHAYRDAIQRSAGAYVLYPGDENRSFREYHELLPGLGAFMLRPTRYGEDDGTPAIEAFLDEVLDHAGSQFSHRERARFWEGRTVAREPVAREPRFAPFLDAPPADVPVLLGYVRDQAQADWIEREGMYNLRAGDRRGAVSLESRELAVALVVTYSDRFPHLRLWRVQGQPRIYLPEDMLRTGYPRGGGSYFCLPVEAVDGDPGGLGVELGRVQGLVGRVGAGGVGAPAVVSWEELMTSGARDE